MSASEIPAEIASACRLDLQASLGGCSEMEIHILFRALTVVAVMVRLLSAAELYDAVTTHIEDNTRQSTLEDRRSPFRSCNDLMRICSNLITTRENGKVEFIHDSMRNFLLGSKLLDYGICHE